MSGNSKDITRKDITRKDITRKDITRKDITRKDITILFLYVKKSYFIFWGFYRFKNLIL